MEVWNQEVMLNAKTGGQSKEKGQVRMSETKVWDQENREGQIVEVVDGGEGEGPGGRMEDRQRRGGEEEGASPKRSPLPNHWRRGRGRDAPSGLPRTRAPPRESFQGHPLSQPHCWVLEKKEISLQASSLLTKV